MSEAEEVLSLDLEEEDYLYRVRRGQHIVYVSVLDITIIPHEARTDRYRVLHILHRLPPWNQKWQTLTVTKSSGDSKYDLDAFSPHTVDVDEALHHQFHMYNFIDLDRVDRISDRLSQVAIDGSTYIVKIARFQHEVEAMKNEIRIYSVLYNHKFNLAPYILGLVYEETIGRIISVIMEEISGRHPNANDLEICRSTVQRLHEIGILHGDINRYNFIITANVAKVIDFETSSYLGNGHHQEKSNELQGLLQQLSDESGVGQR